MKQPANNHVKPVYLPTSAQTFLNRLIGYNFTPSIAPTQGTPQGGPLSPFLSNVVLDELDKEMECRGHRFVRYADDCNIYVQSQRAAERVKASVTRYIEKKLRLKVNEEKSAADLATKRQFLGFSFY